MARATVTMAGQGTAIMAATPLLTADTPQRTTTAATLPHTTADIDRVTMLPPIMVPGTMALGTIGAGDREARRLSRTTRCLRPFLCRGESRVKDSALLADAVAKVESCIDPNFW